MASSTSVGTRDGELCGDATDPSARLGRPRGSAATRCAGTAVRCRTGGRPRPPANRPAPPPRPGNDVRPSSPRHLSRQHQLSHPCPLQRAPPVSDVLGPTEISRDRQASPATTASRMSWDCTVRPGRPTLGSTRATWSEDDGYSDLIADSTVSAPRRRLLSDPRGEAPRPTRSVVSPRVVPTSLLISRRDGGDVCGRYSWLGSRSPPLEGRRTPREVTPLLVARLLDQLR